MNIIDTIILILIGVSVLAAVYRGAVYAGLSLGISVLSLVLSLLLCSPLAALFKSRSGIYDSLLFYFEGHEYISKSSVELSHAAASGTDEKTLDTILANADMPHPFSEKVRKNILSLAYEQEEVYSLGDYFNKTIVDVVLNILAAVLLFFLLRLLCGFLLSAADYSREGFRCLKEYDRLISFGTGLLHGILLVFIVFMLCPVLLGVVPEAGTFLSESVFGSFFYNANPLLLCIPSV